MTRTTADQRAPDDKPDDVEPDPESVARTIALRRLEAAPQTRAQLDEAMRRRGVHDEIRERVLDRFGEVGLIDDAMFAQAWVDSRHPVVGSPSERWRSNCDAGVSSPRSWTTRWPGCRRSRRRDGPIPRGGKTAVDPGSRSGGTNSSAGRNARAEGLSARPGIPGDPRGTGRRRPGGRSPAGGADDRLSSRERDTVATCRRSP